MDINKEYFNRRNNSYVSQDSEKRDYRTTVFAQREVETMTKLVRLSSFDSELNFEGQRILDLGSGDQFLMPEVSRLGGFYTPVDYDTADFNKDALPFSENSFDIVISLAVIEHISNISNFLSEVRRVLKPGGIFYLSTPNFRYCYDTFYNDPTHVRPFTDVGLQKALEIAGFDAVHTFPGARCKSDWFYKGKYRFEKCASLLFSKKKWDTPDALVGRATSVIAVCLNAN